MKIVAAKPRTLTDYFNDSLEIIPEPPEIRFCIKEGGAPFAIPLLDVGVFRIKMMDVLDSLDEGKRVNQSSNSVQICHPKKGLVSLRNNNNVHILSEDSFREFYKAFCDLPNLQKSMDQIKSEGSRPSWCEDEAVVVDKDNMFLDLCDAFKDFNGNPIDNSFIISVTSKMALPWEEGSMGWFRRGLNGGIVCGYVRSYERESYDKKLEEQGYYLIGEVE